MKELTLLLKNNRLAVAAAGGVMLGMAAKSLATPKGTIVDPNNHIVKLDLTPEHYGYISANPDGCVRYETEVGLVALFFKPDAVVPTDTDDNVGPTSTQL